MKEPTTSTLSHNCKNCTHPILTSVKYCSNCGQKNTDGRISLTSFFSVFFSVVFNLESKFFQTMGHIFIPGKLTVEYFKGKHKRYFHPVRLFIVSALFLIAAIGSQMTEDLMLINMHNRVENQVRINKFLMDMDTVAQQTLEKFPNNTSLAPAFDTLHEDLKERTLDREDSINMNSFIFGHGFVNLDFSISNEDYLNLNSEELIDKYKVTGRLERFVFKRKVKLSKDNGNFAPFLLGNSLWIILLMMPFLSLILKVLYLRRDYYFVEHLVFSFHTHSFAFLLFAIIGFLFFLGAPNWLVGIGFLVLFLYLYKALRKVYGQGRFKTLVKLLFANAIYFFLFLFFLLFGFLASMAIF